MEDFFYIVPKTLVKLVDLSGVHPAEDLRIVSEKSVTLVDLSGALLGYGRWDMLKTRALKKNVNGVALPHGTNNHMV